MNLYELQFTGQKIGAEISSKINNVPLSIALKDKVKYHQEQIDKINATLTFLESNKDIEKLLYLLAEVH